MKYKTTECETQLSQSCQALKDLVAEFEKLSLAYGIEPTITRVWEPVAGDSGVHEAKRAVDCRDETRDTQGSHFLYGPDQAVEIVASLNQKYPRADGHVVCIHHSFQGMPEHFHLQVSYGQSLHGLSYAQ